jgi:Tfp pilus assembly protein PilV
MRLPAPARRGVSLLEALIACTILFIAVFSINQLADSAGKQAIQVRERSLGMQLAQSKLNEVNAAVLSLNSQGGDFEEAPGWEYTIDATQNEVANLWNVTVSVKRQNSDTTVASLSQVMIDPSIRGNSTDKAQVTGADPNSSSTDPTAGQSSNTQTQTQTQTQTPAQSPSAGSQPSGGAAKPSGGASQPASSGAKPSGGTSSPSTGTSAPSSSGTKGSTGTGGTGTGTSGTGNKGSTGSGTTGSGTSGSKGN